MSDPSPHPPVISHRGTTLASRTPPVTPGYRFVTADDASAWDSSGGLVTLPESDRLDAFDRLTHDDCALVIVCSPRQESAVRRASALARSRNQARVAVVAVALGPLGLSVVTQLASELVASGSSRPVAEIVGWLPAVADSVLDLGLVSSVARLDHPEVRVRHHLLSYLPGRRLFVVQIAPRPSLSSINTAGVLTPRAPFGPEIESGFGRVITIAGRQSVPTEVLAVCGRATRTDTVPAGPTLAGFWRDADAAELVVSPAQVSTWAQAQLSVAEIRSCAWCGEPLTATIRSCPFCGNALP